MKANSVMKVSDTIDEVSAVLGISLVGGEFLWTCLADGDILALGHMLVGAAWRLCASVGVRESSGTGKEAQR